MAEATITFENEIWKPVPGLEGFYMASSLGRIMRLERAVNAKCGGKRVWPTLIAEGHMGHRGYQKVKVFGRDREVHRLVCLAFHGPAPSPKHHAAHRDDIKTNNLPGNLRWATPLENAEDRIRNGLQVRGERISFAKLTDDQVRAIRAEHRGKYGDGKRIAAKYGIDQGTVISIVKRRTWRHID